MIVFVESILTTRAEEEKRVPVPIKVFNFQASVCKKKDDDS
jgi:hypothetical protein